MARELGTEASVLADAEARLERELPTRRLGLEEAREWLADVAHAEDVDPPAVVRAKMPRRFAGVALDHEHAVVVRTTTPSQLTLLHELAHIMGCGGHGAQFRECLVGLLRRHVSLQHSLLLAEALGEA